MPEEVLVIVIIAIVAGTFTSVVKQIIGYLQSRGGKAEGQSSLTESQLRHLIERSVDASIQPLERRFDAIEDRLTRVLESAPERRQLMNPEEERAERELP